MNYERSNVIERNINIFKTRASDLDIGRWPKQGMMLRVKFGVTSFQRTRVRIYGMGKK